MEMLKSVSLGFLLGFYDSLKGIVIVFNVDREMSKRNINKKDKELTASTRKIQSESKIMQQVFRCCALNGGTVWLSIIVVEYGILPLFKGVYDKDDSSEPPLIDWSWVQSLSLLIFRIIWLLPIFVLSKLINALWFQDIANSIYSFRKGRPQPIMSISKSIADMLFGLIVEVLFALECMLFVLIPIKYVGYPLYLVHMSILYALYSFEYKWINMGWELHKRLHFIERNWPYFLGFGMPLTILTQLTNSYIISGCVFSIAFPIFILSGNDAAPSGGYCDVPLRLFAPVVAISNLLFRRTVVKKPQIPTKASSNVRTFSSGKISSR